jgi:hypothetical protein
MYEIGDIVELKSAYSGVRIINPRGIITSIKHNKNNKRLYEVRIPPCMVKGRYYDNKIFAYENEMKLIW